MNRQDVTDNGLVAIIRLKDSEAVVPVAKALVEGGVRVLEVTLNTPGALEHIATLRQDLAGQAFVGAGTVLTIEDCRLALKAGAEFIVTPTLQTDTIALCNAEQAPILCGCFTPTEAYTAHTAGADFVKIFPATSLGASYLRDLRGPLPQLRLVPTGGVDADNLHEFFAAGSAAVAVGGCLVAADLVTKKDWTALVNRAAHFVHRVAEAKQA